MQVKETPVLVTRRATREGVEHLPKPPGFKCRPDKFFRYWNSLPEKYWDRITVYVYRLWPVVDRVKAGRSKYIDKVAKPIDRDDIAHRYGSGDYALNMTDSEVGKEVCRCLLRGDDGIRDQDIEPVLDIAELVMDDPANASFIARLQSKGVLTKSKNEGEEEDNMATSEAVKAMAETTRHMADKMMEQQKAPASSAMEQQALAKSMEMIARTAERSNEMVDKAVDRAAAISLKSSDGLGLLSEVVTVIEKLGGGKSDSSGGIRDLMPLITMTMEQTKEASERNNTLILEMIRTKNEAAAPRDLMDDLDRLAQMKETFQSLFGPPPQKEETGGWTNHIPLIVTGLGIVGTMIYNFAVAKTGNGAPVPPPPVPTNPELPAPETDPEMSMYIDLVKKIEPALVASLVKGETGAMFAEALAASQGQPMVNQLRQAGRDNILALLKLHPPLWTRLNESERFPTFLDEFLASAPAKPLPKTKAN